MFKRLFGDLPPTPKTQRTILEAGVAVVKMATGLIRKGKRLAVCCN